MGNNKPYLFISGLREVAKNLRGDERIFIGIRPFGFHAGNIMPLIVYPYLLCEEVKRLGKPVEFKFYYSINDWEPDIPYGPDKANFPLNVWPKQHSLQFLQSNEDPDKTVVDFWQPIIEKHIRILLNHFNNVEIKVIRNSDLKYTNEFKKMILKTLKYPSDLGELMRANSGGNQLFGNVDFAGAVCPICKSAVGKTNIDLNNKIYYSCFICFYLSDGEYEDFDFWWHHKPMWVARVEYLKIDLAISGGDHYSEGDFKMRAAAANFFDPEIVIPKMLFTPTLISVDGIRMSKTKGNSLFGRIDTLIQKARAVDCEEFLIDKSEYYADVKEAKEYFSSF